MAPADRASSKRGRSNDGCASTRNVRNNAASRTESSRAFSGSRYTSTSRRSSTESLQGYGRKRVAAPLQHLARSERPVYGASSHTSAGDVRNIAATIEQPPPAEVNEADIDTLDEVIMAVNLSDRGTVGCAYYVAREEKLYFMEDVQLGGADIVDQRMLLAGIFPLIHIRLTLV